MARDELWDAVNSLKDYIESHQLRWPVVESLPVSDWIRTVGHGRMMALAQIAGHDGSHQRGIKT